MRRRLDIAGQFGYFTHLVPASPRRRVVTKPYKEVLVSIEFLSHWNCHCLICGKIDFGQDRETCSHCGSSAIERIPNCELHLHSKLGAFIGDE